VRTRNLNQFVYKFARVTRSTTIVNAEHHMVSPFLISLHCSYSKLILERCFRCVGSFFDKVFKRF
jgi:hypothetical protein